MDLRIEKVLSLWEKGREDVYKFLEMGPDPTRA